MLFAFVTGVYVCLCVCTCTLSWQGEESGQAGSLGEPPTPSVWRLLTQSRPRVAPSSPAGNGGCPELGEVGCLCRVAVQGLDRGGVGFGLIASLHFAATELKPDVGTPELPPGTVRARLDADGSIVEVDEAEVQKVGASILA